MRNPLPALAIAAALALPSTAAADEKAKKPQQAFIEKSLVQVPKKAGIYTLEKTTYEPEQFAAGVRTLYEVEGVPKEFTLSLFAYPQGRSKETETVDAQIAGVEQVIRMQPDYSEILAGPRTSFVVDAPKVTAPPKGKDDGRKQLITFTGPAKDATPATDEAPKPDAKTAAPAADDDLAEFLRETVAPPQTTGRRQAFDMRYKGVPTRSVGYVFYRNLFNIKLRVSVPADKMDAPAFNAAADAAAKVLVPLVDIQNFGDCGNITISLPTDSGKSKDEDANDTAKLLMRELGRVQRENCASSQGRKQQAVPEGYERTEIVYPPEIWNSD